jgi:hypothetical protein
MSNQNHILWAIANSTFSGDQIAATFRRNADSSKRNAKDREKRSQNGQCDYLEGVVATVKWLGDGGVQIIVKKKEGGYGSLTDSQEIFSLSHKGQEIL